MPTFEYQAQRNDGSATSGIVFAAGLDAAIQELSQRGLSVSSIQQARSLGDPLANMGASNPMAGQNPTLSAPSGQATEQHVSIPPYQTGSYGEQVTHESVVKGPPTEQRSYMATSVAGPLVGKVSLAILSFFFSQLATMLNAGVPYVQALDTLSKQQRDPRFKKVVTELRDHVQAGRPISVGMQRYPEVFSPIMMSIVRVGEEGGFLDSALKQTAEYIDQEIELRNLYRRVTFYPKLQLALSAIIILATNAILAAIKPGSKGLSSPLTTASTWFWLAPLIIFTFLFLRVGLANFRIRYVWDAVISYIPYLGKTMRMLAMAKFGRSFGALYRSGVPMTKSIKLAADSCGNEYLRALILPASTRIESGAGVTETLVTTGAFSPIVIDMMRTGESTGNLDGMLHKVADYYEEDSKVRATQMGHVFGVFIFLCVAVYIGFIVVSFYSGMASGYLDQVNGT